MSWLRFQGAAPASDVATGTDALTATGIATGAPTVASPALGQIHKPTATGIDTGAPSVGTPALAQIHGLATATLDAGAPTVASPAIGQVHVLAATGIATGAPTVGTPALAGVVYDLTAAGIATGAPTAASPILGQVHALAAVGLATGAPTVGTTAIDAAVALETALYTRLAADAEVAALVGARIYPVLAPQGAARPFVVFARQRQQTLGALAGRAGHREVEVAVMCFADTVGDAMATGRAVRNALDGARDNTLRAVRLTGRLQAAVGEVGAEPLPVSDAMLFRVISAAAA